MTQTVALDAVTKAARDIIDTGYAVVKLADLDANRLRTAISTAVDFFQRPEEDKLKHGSDDHNYGYRPFGIGVYMDSFFYGNDYWLGDPWQYRLPPAYGSMRWIRYYDDALLVDIRDGYVVDVIRNFFW